MNVTTADVMKQKLRQWMLEALEFGVDLFCWLRVVTQNWKALPLLWPSCCSDNGSICGGVEAPLVSPEGLYLHMTSCTLSRFPLDKFHSIYVTLPVAKSACR